MKYVSEGFSPTPQYEIADEPKSIMLECGCCKKEFKSEDFTFGELTEPTFEIATAGIDEDAEDANYNENAYLCYECYRSIKTSDSHNGITILSHSKQRETNLKALIEIAKNK